MSAAMTASSANIHKQYLTNNGYSALQTSERCFPAKIITTNIKYSNVIICLLHDSIKINAYTLCCLS